MRNVLLLIFSMLSLGNCHLRLTFPQPRDYALDFLDNVRTAPPCGGMVYDEDTSQITTLETGRDIMITWHSAYPHMGGIRLELLNATTNAVIANLTAGDEYQYTNDSTTLTHTMNLAADMVCDHCILRLIRQAGEWTAGVDGYLFWSCADVKIMAGGAADTCYTGQCLNGGACAAGVCTCPNTYHGDRCQNKNDCETAVDCNSNGACIDTDSTYYPKKMCFCNAGKMGRYCSKDSPISNAKKTTTELNAYHHIQLNANPPFDMYWTLIGTNKDEIEFVVIAETNNWVALGWRPNNLAATCRNFPVINGSGAAIPEPEVTPEPGTHPEPEVTPEPTGTPEPVTPEPTTAAARRRRAVEEQERYVNRQKREAATTNVVKELCLAGNVSGALAWATADYDSTGAQPEPEGEPAPEGTPVPEGEGTPAPEPEGEGVAGNLHAMDCQDIIYISAVGNRHRILDSYTRDRATPQPDSFYGGTDDLTAAAALREDGMIHAVFRRKLATSDKADHILQDASSRFIWARGQDPKRFYHRPPTGLERCLASDYDYYRVNELKYHGTKDTQRGAQTINVFDDPDATETANEGTRGSPAGCTDACDFSVSWVYRESTDLVQFTVTAIVGANQWAALGFSKDDRLMPSTDAVVGWMNAGATMPTLTDRYITSRTPDGVTLDANQNINNMGGSYNNGRLTYTFTRALSPTDPGNDQPLSECVYLLFAWGGGVSGNDLTRHSNTDSTSDRICISSSGRITLSWIMIISAFIASRFVSQ